MQKLGATKTYNSMNLEIPDSNNMMSSKNVTVGSTSTRSTSRVSVVDRTTFSSRQNMVKKTSTQKHKRGSSKRLSEDDIESNMTQSTKDGQELELLIDDDEDAFTKEKKAAEVQRLKDLIQEKMREKFLRDLKRSQAAQELKFQ